MSALQPPHRVSHRHELREDQVITTYARAWSFFDENRKLVYGALAAVAVLGLIIAGWAFYQSGQQSKAVVAMAPAVRAYEQGNYRVAVEGAEGTMGLAAVADEYGSTDAGNLAAFYAADAYFRIGEYDRALEYFDEYDGEKNILGASAIAGEAAAYEAKGEYDRAAEHYREAAEHFESELTSPQYLFDAARALEAAGKHNEAVALYERVREDYAESTLAANVDFYIARAQARVAAGS